MSHEQEQQYNQPQPIFSHGAQEALARAQKEAQMYQHSFVGTEHLLLGVVANKRITARLAFAGIGLSANRLRARMEPMQMLGSNPTTEERGLTPLARNAIQIASQLALKEQAEAIGLEHIFRGLVAQKNGIGYRALVSCFEELLIPEAEIEQRITDALRLPESP